ncbi:phosphotransferase [Oceaniglobus trochenteri]|uniref:phosphotransferase n=1 Tax=Oceaniglobus trochenteri TaxID=2763260 RepID=UPI001CFF8478
MHAATAGREDIAARFSHDETFHALRLEPYLEATARAHSSLSGALMGQRRSVSDTKRALVLGDFSPKNILVRPRGPVFLNVECARYGAPCFDLAFYLDHLLLKSLHLRAARAELLARWMRPRTPNSAPRLGSCAARSRHARRSCCLA